MISLHLLLLCHSLSSRLSRYYLHQPKHEVISVFSPGHETPLRRYPAAYLRRFRVLYSYITKTTRLMASWESSQCHIGTNNKISFKKNVSLTAIYDTMKIERIGVVKEVTPPQPRTMGDAHIRQESHRVYNYVRCDQALSCLLSSKHKTFV